MKATGKLAPRLVPVAAFVLLLVALVAVNVLAAFVPLRLDITEEGLYTLSKGTREIVGQISEPVTLKLYYSQSVPDVPVQFKTYSTKVIELLREYEAAAPAGKVKLEIHDPAPDTETEEWATRYGLTPGRLPNGAGLYFGLVAVSADREATVPFFDPRREKFLEYDISEALTRVESAERPKLGVLSYLPIGGYGSVPMMAQQSGDWAIMATLQKNYEVQLLTPDSLVTVPEDVGLLLVVHPKVMPARVSYALDQFLLRGGKLVALIDPNSRVDTSGGGQYGAPTNSSLDALFKAWGVEFDRMRIVGDQELATRVNAPQFGVIDYPIWLTVPKRYLNDGQVITSELEELMLVDSGRISTNDQFKLKFTPLVSSSANSGMVDFTAVRVMNPVNLSKLIETDNQQKTLAALITGKFPSAFPDGPPPPTKTPTGEDPPKEMQAELDARKAHHRAEAQAETSVVLIADADFIADQFSVQQVNFFGNIVTQPVNDNLSLVLNSIEFLAGNQALIHIRSRGKFSRPFSTVAALQVQAAERFKAEEQRLSDKLEDVKRKLSELERARPQGENLMLSPDQLEAVRQFRLEEQRTRRALRDVRKVLRQDIESLGNLLLAVNLLAVPALVALFGFVVIYRRTRRSGGRR